MRRASEHSKKAVILLSIMILISLATLAFFYLNTRTDEIAVAKAEQKYIPLVISVHEDGQQLFSELFLYHPITGKGSLLDIPGELGMMIDSLNRIDRIDTVYDSEDPSAYRKAVEAVAGIDIPYYITISLDDLEQVIDLLGGIHVFIANPVEYLENGEMVLLPSGSVLLDGAKAKMFASYRDPAESELEMVNRRQRLVQAFLGKLGEEAQLLRQQKGLDLFEDNVETSLSKRALSSYIEGLSIFDADRMIFQRVLGARRMVDGEQLLFPHYEGKLVRETVDQTLISIANEDVVSDEELSLSLRILNGTERNGLAGRTGNVMKSYGYEVSAVGNADEQGLEKTYVLDHTGDITKAQRVAKLIHCNEVKSAADTDLSPVSGSDIFIDVTIVLGKDFDGRHCKSD